MDAITGYISAHPAVLVIGLVIIVVLFLQFTFKSLIKLVLIMLFILLAAFGYYYFKDPGAMPKNIMESIESGINGFSDRSKTFLKDSKDLYKKGKEAPGDVNKLLKDSDKELDKDLKK
jgi:hypothetical protein